LQDFLENQQPAVAMDLQDVLPSIRLGLAHEDQENFVENGPIPGADDFSEVESMGKKWTRTLPAAKDLPGDRLSLRTAAPHDPNAPHPYRSGDGGDGIPRQSMGHEGFFSGLMTIFR
jgi:hypothetical protein